MLVISKRLQIKMKKHTALAYDTIKLSEVSKNSLLLMPVQLGYISWLK